MKKILSLMLSKVLLNLSKSERLNFAEVTNQMTSIQEMIFWLNGLSYQKVEELLAKKELLNADVKLAEKELKRLTFSIESNKKVLLEIQDKHRVFLDDLEDIKRQIAELNVPQPPNPPQEDRKSHAPNPVAEEIVLESQDCVQMTEANLPKSHSDLMIDKMNEDKYMSDGEWHLRNDSND